VPEATTQTVKGLYQFYAARSDRQLALGKDNVKTKGLAKGTYMSMEVIINSHLVSRKHKCRVLRSDRLSQYCVYVENQRGYEFQVQGSSKRKAIGPGALAAINKKQRGMALPS
jgi:hypothetical protein